MAADKRRAERHLKEMLMAMNNHRNDLAAHSDNRDTLRAARCEQLLKFNYSRIRKHCARHDLELPHDVPPESAA